jgi:CubicO group peptidase (beta-lactamase class C family)
MRKRWYLLSIVPALIGASLATAELRESRLPPTVRTPAAIVAFLDSAVPEWIERYRVPAVCTGVVAARDEHLRCYGTTRSRDGRRVDGRTRFGVASVSKTFTGLAVLTLAARRRVSLDDPVERHLRTWRFPTGPYDGSNVTIRQLLTHTAGVGISSYGGVGSTGATETTRDVLEGVGPGRAPVTLILPPGSGFRYSGGGYMALQLLVEDVTGVPFERFVAEQVFAPLGMRDSSFSWGSQGESDAAGHDVAGRPLPLHAYGAAMGPGGMVTTADDMLRFVSAFAHARAGVLLGWPAALWDEYLSAGQGRYGMGLTLTDANGHVLVGHGGTTMGYNASFTAAPAEGFGWFVLENGNGGVFLKARLDPVFLQWKTGWTDPRYRVLQALQAAVAFLGALLPGFGVLLLASFALTAGPARRLLVLKGRLGVARKAVRIVLAVLVFAFVAFWVLFFHTQAFYPAFTTAWMPFAFRFVTLGVALIGLRVILSCVFLGRDDGAAARKPGDLARPETV